MANGSDIPPHRRRKKGTLKHRSTHDVSMVVGVQAQAFINSLVSSKRLEMTKNEGLEKRLKAHSLVVYIDGHKFYVDPLELYKGDPESYRRYLELCGDDISDHM